MRIRLEVDEKLSENEILIRCNSLDDNIRKIEAIIKDINFNKESFIFYKEEKEYYFPLERILFFETSDKLIDAHTVDNVYQIKYKLYELEKILPFNFIRVSKSTILNINHIYSINHSITSSSTVEFDGSYKQVYVSRFYYKELKNRLKERKNYER
jgi:DNA-binding LytR/AlgR family response regulator